MAIEAFAMSVTDKSAATFQIPVVAVVKMVSASVVVVVEQISQQQLMPKDRFTTKDPRNIVQRQAKAKTDAKEAQQCCDVLDGS